MPRSLFQVPGIIAVLALLVFCHACSLSEKPLRLTADPALDNVSQGDTGPDTNTDTGPDAEPDTEPDTPEGTPGTFDCSPACSAQQLCLPSGLCAEMTQTCAQEGQLCDAAATAPTVVWICEPSYSGRGGTCRRVCESPTDCNNDTDACVESPNLSAVKVCAPSCADDDDEACNPIQTCVGAGVSRHCEAACKPVIEDQCGQEATCNPIDGHVGRCVPTGEQRNGLPCDEDTLCRAGTFCLDLGSGARCQTPCRPDSNDHNDCDDDESCIALNVEDLGICLPQCAAFDDDPDCRAGFGCLPRGTNEAVCFPKSGGNVGADCLGTSSCREDLECVLESETEGTCTKLCLRDAETGERGACPDAQTCRSLSGGGDVGFCR